MFSRIVMDEEGHMDWLKQQLDLIKRIGESAYIAQHMTLFLKLRRRRSAGRDARYFYSPARRFAAAGESALTPQAGLPGGAPC